MKKLKEPDVIIENKSSLGHILTWYNTERTKDDAKQYLLDYCTEFHPEYVKVVDKISSTNIVPTYGWISHLIQKRGVDGAPYSDRIAEYLSNLDPSSFSEAKPYLVKYQKKEFDVDDFIGSLEEKIDKFFIKGEEFNINDDIKRLNLSSKCLNIIKEWADRKIDDFSVSEENLTYEEEGGVKTVREHLFSLHSKQLQKLISSLTIQRVKKSKKIVKKKIDVNKQVSKVKYQEVYGDYKSINPVHIIGAKMCVTYNTRYNVLSIFKADIASGLFIKGSSIYNFSESLGKKKLKNPVMNLKVLTTCSKEEIMKLYDSLKAKPSKLSGQFNEHTLILRVEQ